MRISDWSSDVCSSDLTARFERVYSRDGARAALDDFAPPEVIKADGLAAGKGVTIAETREEAEAAIDALIAAGRAGGEAAIEACLDGGGTSIFTRPDGTSVMRFGAAQDHKRVVEGADERTGVAGGMTRKRRR